MEPEPQLEHRQRASPLLAGLPADRREVQLQQGDGEAPGPRLLSQVDREPLSCWEDGLDPACAALAAGGGQDAGGREHDRAHQRGRGAEQEGDAADPQGPRVGEQQLEHDQGQPPREAAVALVQGAGRHGLPDVHADRALARRAQGLEAHPLQRLRVRQEQLAPHPARLAPRPRAHPRQPHRALHVVEPAGGSEAHRCRHEALAHLPHVLGRVEDGVARGSARRGMGRRERKARRGAGCAGDGS
mmetsp:Transcript_33012/g.77873  ORF Transcript_33012/g.77873 Transcript_33012/m.77873 type:complete len:244 (+) Transcript_33012:2185-2916(+)